MVSIDTAKSAAKKQIIPLKSSRKVFSQKNSTVDGLFGSLEATIEQFGILGKTIPVGLAFYEVVYDKQGVPLDVVTLEVNPEYQKVFGLTREQLVNKPLAKFYPQIRKEPFDWIALFGRVATSGKPEHFQICYPVNQRHYNVNVFSPIKGYCFSAFYDITEQKQNTIQEIETRKKIEASLRESVEKYQYLLKHAPTGVCEIAYNGPKFLSVNQAICQILGYNEQELLAMNPIDLLYPESIKNFQKQVALILDGKKVCGPVEYQVKTKDGKGIWAEIHLDLKCRDGIAESALIIVHDVTARKKAQQQLLFTEMRYRRLYETTRDGIMARDLQGRMIDCNQAYAKMLGYTKKELKQKTIQQLLPESWHEQRDRVVKKVLQTGRSILFEREYTRKDGTIFPASVRTWRLTDGKGRVIGIWSIVRDISEQKKYQKDLKEHAEALKKIVEDRTKQLKDSERLVAIGQTAGMVGHDLRNPLQTVIGELFLSKTEVDSLRASQAKKNLQDSIQIIEEQIVYMNKIVSDLQAFVQPVKTDKKTVDLKALINGILSSVAIPGNVSVRTQISNGFPQISADVQLLKRVLINLTTNAVQAMPDGGKLYITAVVNSQGQVSITMRDTGVGIPDKIKNQIFTPLFTTKPRGQGFGLAVCKRVIEAHGGTITFTSTEGKGAEFTIQLPAS